MRKTATRLTILGAAVLLATAGAGCGSSGSREGEIGTVDPSLVVQKGDPALAPAAGYAGSGSCVPCHPRQYDGWARSLHNAALKTVAELGDGIFVNDADQNGLNDFRDGRALSSDPDFSAFGANAPKLGFSGGKYFATIGTVSYEIQRVQGGNGYWKQRYQTKVGRSYYLLPFQYNEKTKEYVRYDDGNWYLGTAPRFTEPYGSDNLVLQFAALNNPTDRKGTAVSWENRCAGCHQTGLSVASQTTTYGAASVPEAVTGYSELNIGCERCHGPGARHVQTRDPADIVNPGNFPSQGAAGLRLANQVCGACHSRGQGNATLASLSLPLEYPARFEGSALALPLPGDGVVDNSAGNPFVILNTSSAYYGVPPLPFFSAYGGWYSGATFSYDFPTYLASRQHRQQWTDLEQGRHSGDAGGTTCWSCHDPHQRAGDHQVRDSVTVAGVTIPTENDDNSLCLSCHAADFGLTLDDVKTGAPAVAAGVLAHMGAEAVMGQVPYDPAGTGVGRCSKCHMPKTASSAVRTPVGTGAIREGDIHSHTFTFLWPSGNALVPGNGAEMASGCYAGGCHDDTPSGTAFVQPLADWSLSPHADFTGEPFRHWDEDGEVPASCAKCHSRTGFRDYAKDGRVQAAAKLGTVISCGACHSSAGDGSTLWDERTEYQGLDPVVFPSGLAADLGDSSNLCAVCHQGRASKFTVDEAIAAKPGGPYDFVNIHYFAAAATLFGTDVKGGYEYDDNSSVGARTYVGRFLHAPPYRDTCIRCHMGSGAPDLDENRHAFEPKPAYCRACHASDIDDPSDPAHPYRDIRFGILGGTLGIDFDGDGDATEGLYYEVWDPLAPDLLAAIREYAAGTLDRPIAYSPDVYPYFFNDPNGNGIVDPGEDDFGNRYRDFDATLLEAAYNYQVVRKDPCGYVHNGKYVIQLLRDSIEDLRGVPPPGVRP